MQDTEQTTTMQNMYRLKKRSDEGTPVAILPKCGL